jgi:hypothetical protein
MGYTTMYPWPKGISYNNVPCKVLELMFQAGETDLATRISQPH